MEGWKTGRMGATPPVEFCRNLLSAQILIIRCKVAVALRGCEEISRSGLAERDGYFGYGRTNLPSFQPSILPSRPGNIVGLTV